MPLVSYVGLSSQGCLLPGLIIFNLLFGRFFIKSFSLWLGLEAGLVLIFALQIKLLVSRLNKQFSSTRQKAQNYKAQGKVVDIQGQVVEDERKVLRSAK